MNRAEFDKAQQANLEQQRAEIARRRADTKGRANAPGPPLATCDECGAFAPYATGDFGKPTDHPERFCRRHAPESLRGPGVSRNHQHP